MSTPDPDAVMVAAVLAASDQPMTTELLLSAARAYEALKSSREREERGRVETAAGALDGAPLVINRDRRTLLADVGAGRVYRSHGGCDLRAVRRGQNWRVDRRLRPLREHGLVALAADGRTYALTAAGSAALESYVPQAGPREAR